MEPIALEGGDGARVEMERGHGLEIEHGRRQGESKGLSFGGPNPRRQGEGTGWKRIAGIGGASARDSVSKVRIRTG